VKQCDPQVNQIFSVLFYILLSSCATQQEPLPSEPVAKAKQTDLSSLKIGMSSAEAEKLLGKPAAITETATSITSTWVVGSPVIQAKNKPKQESHDGMAYQLGSIAASAAGYVIPGFGLASQLGTVIYNSTENSPKSKQDVQSPKTNAESLIVTIEFRDDKAYSIQRAHPDVLAPNIK
jgi:hypothetical protein